MALTRWLLVAPLALLAGGSWYVTRHVASEHPSRPAGAASHAGAQALVGGFRIPELGDQDEFELKLSLRIEITPLESGTPTANELSVTGSWATAVVERRAGTVTRRLVLSRVEAGPSNASPASRRDSELARQLSSPLYASYDSEGRIQGVVFPPTAVGPARAILANDRSRWPRWCAQGTLSNLLAPS